MAEFDYVAIDPAGKERKGALKAQTLEDARAKLDARKLFIVELSAGAVEVARKRTGLSLRTPRGPVEVQSTRFLASLTYGPNADLPFEAAVIEIDALAVTQADGVLSAEKLVLALRRKISPSGSAAARRMPTWPKVPTSATATVPRMARRPARITPSSVSSSSAISVLV